MHLATVEVGRKTPRDGKIELDAEAAARLRDAAPNAAEATGAAGAAAPSFGFVLNAAAETVDDPVRGDARLLSMPCTCDKAAAGGAHEHHFLESPAFARLPPGTALTVDLEDDGQLKIARAVGA